MNFFIEFDKISIEDPTDCLKVYEDMKTASGNTVKVSYLPSRFLSSSVEPSMADIISPWCNSATFAEAVEGTRQLHLHITRS